MTEIRDLTPPRDTSRTVDLRDFGFVGRVSDEALAEIKRQERRRARALVTAHLFIFGDAR